jgi:hypothetical protein
VPTLAGSTTRAVGAEFGWTVGLSKQAMNTQAFDGTQASAALRGVGMVFSPVDPLYALFRSVVIDGVAAGLLIVALVVLGSMRSVLSRLALPAWLHLLAWTSAALMVGAPTEPCCGQAECLRSRSGADRALDEWCERGDSNPHDLGSVDFESTASTVPPLSRGAAFTPSRATCHRLRPGGGFAIRSAR